jgi:lipopolysaccharide export system ATP-binding protein
MTIRAENLRRAYRKRLVVRDVSLEVAQGEVVGLLGPNGAGKTTTFYMIVGLIRPHGGRVFLGEREITRLPMYQRARLGLGYLPQEASVFRQLTVEQNLLLVMEMRGIPPKERRERAEQLMTEFHIAHLRHSKGYALSGGERRRVEIARALALQPAFLLLDEPFTGIDPKTIEELQEIILGLTRAQYRRADYRPQCERDAAHYRPQLHPCGRRDCGAGRARRGDCRPARTEILLRGEFRAVI